MEAVTREKQPCSGLFFLLLQSKALVGKRKKKGQRSEEL